MNKFIGVHCDIKIYGQIICSHMNILFTIYFDPTLANTLTCKTWTMNAPIYQVIALN